MEIGLIILIIIALIPIILVAFYIASKLKGKITIQLDKTQFSTGEEIKGTVLLDLKKPLSAKNLKVGLEGFQKTRSYDSRGGVSTSDRMVFEFLENVGGEKVYPQGQSTYNISLKIPSDVRNSLNNPTLKAIMGTISAVTGTGYPIRWYVVSYLDIKGFNLKGRKQINIS